MADELTTATADQGAGACDGRPRGRPRSADRDEAILEATVGLLKTVGYDKMRVQDVAQEAGVGLATIYRRWETKQALVVDAIEHMGREIEAIPRTGDAYEDLVVLVEHAVDKMCATEEEFLPGIVTALRSDPEVAAAIRSAVIDQVRERYREVLVELLGPDAPDIDLRCELVPALLLFDQTVGTNRRSDPTLVRRLAALLAGR